MKRFIAAFLAMAMGFSPAFAADQTTLSLPQLLEETRRVNPGILAARKKWEAMQAKIPQATGLPAPKIGVEFEEIPRGSFKIDKATTIYQLIQSLPFPGKLSLKQQVAIQEAQVAASGYKQTEWDVLWHVKETYYNLFLLDREMEIEEEQILWLRQAASAAQARYATGQAPEGELLRAQAAVLEAANEREVLIHRRLAAAAHMNHLLNRPGDASVEKPPPVEFLAVPGSPEELLGTALIHQPELLAFQFSAGRAEAAWKLSKRELLPDLETMLELRDPAAGPIGPWDLTLALVLPFWFWTKQRYGVTVALHDKESAQAAYQAMRNEITTRIHEYWHQAQASYATVKLCRESLIPLAHQAVASDLAAYQGGRLSFMELIDAFRILGERRRTYNQHLVALEQEMSLLELSVGVPLRDLHRIVGKEGS